MDYADKHNLEFIPMSVSPAYKACGVPMGPVSDYVDRMLLQDTALDQYVTRLEAAKSPFITDRCFLDLLAYALADYPQNPTDHEATWFLSYSYKCVALTAQYFDKVMLIRPGIPLEKCETSWAADMGVVAQVDACMLWAADQLESLVFQLPVHTTLHSARMAALEIYHNAKL
jgi:hypothetical protein